MHKTKGIAPLVIVGIMAALAVVGGGAYYLVSVGGSELPANEVLENMIGNTLNLKSFTFDIESSGVASGGVRTTEAGVGEMIYEAEVSGAVDNTDIENPSLEASVSLDSVAREGNSEVAVKMSLDSIFKDGVMYISINDFDVENKSGAQSQSTFILSMVAQVINGLQSKWISFESKSEEESILTKQNVGQFQSNLSLVREDVKDAEYLVVEKNHGLERIGFNKAYRYTLSLDLNEVSKISKKLYDKKGLDEAEIKKKVEEIEETLKEHNVSPIFDVWIDTDDFNVVKLEIDNSQFYDQGGATDITGQTVINLSKFNESQKIKAPKSSTPFEQVLQQVLGGGPAKIRW